MSRLYMSMEISNKSWKLCFSAGGKKKRRRDLLADEYHKLPEMIQEAKSKLGLAPGAEVVSCHEAGLQGFWIHRFLEKCVVKSLVLDPSSIEVNRRRRRAKTDRLDVIKLMHMLIRHEGGETGMWSVINPPSVEAEDVRRMWRELGRVQKELTQHHNRILSLLRLHGPITIAINTRFKKKLERVTTWEGEAFPENILAEIQHEYARWELVREQGKETMRRMNQMAEKGETKAAGQIKMLQNLKGIGFKGSWGLTCEMFGWRKFKNRKQVGSYMGITGTPYDSGSAKKDQGISKAGNARVRALMNELAWLWLRHQPDSELALWFFRRTFGASKRVRRVMIVALARKLAIALWRFVESGHVPSGAVLKIP
jgi:transposase